ncbi:CMRF35-like molecule 1 isoform X1, partial [Arapaima gigas]
FPAGVLGTVSTVGDLTVLEGRSVTVPCNYEPQYASNVKYWCRGSIKDFCKSLARTDSSPTDSRVEIHDDPTQLVFSVTMSDLREGDSAWYWCGVEVGGIWKADDTTSLYISVIHGVSVTKHMVTGEEGGSVSLKCLYSDRHRASVKKWCRSGDWNSCVTLGVNGTLETDSVVISDDHSGAFTVTLLDLGKKDMGWYRCVAGYQQATVHVTVVPRPTPTAIYTTSMWVLNPDLERQPDTKPRQDVWESPVLICGLLIFLVLTVIVTWKRWGQDRLKRREVLERETTLLKHPEVSKDQADFSTVFFNSRSEQLQVL